MGQGLFSDNAKKAKKILHIAGIPANSPAYKVLKGTIEEMVSELNTMTSEEQAKFALTAVRIYARYVRNAYNAQHKTMKEKSEDHIIELDKFHSAIDALLKKIALYMAEKKTSAITFTELNELFGSKAERAKNLLDRCTQLIECNENEKCYQFKTELATQLQNYFVDLQRNEQQNTFSNSPAPHQ